MKKEEYLETGTLLFGKGENYGCDQTVHMV